MPVKVQPKSHQTEQPQEQWMLDDPELAEIFKGSRKLTPEETKREQEIADSIVLVNLDEF